MTLRNFALVAVLVGGCDNSSSNDDNEPPDRHWSRKASRSSASTPSATRRNGPTRCACTRSSAPRSIPTTALSVGLKVDADALPAAVVQGIQNGSVDLTSPATTVALLKLDAVVGVKGTVESVGGHDTLTRVGVTCALCHSTVDNSFAPGIGKRLDGWPNRDLNPGAILALSPAFDAAAKAVLNSWGPGKYDPRHNSTA